MTIENTAAMSVPAVAQSNEPSGIEQQVSVIGPPENLGVGRTKEHITTASRIGQEFFVPRVHKRVRICPAVPVGWILVKIADVRFIRVYSRRFAVEQQLRDAPVNPKQYQIFYLHVVKKAPVREVAETLNVSSGQVYLAKHRICALLKKEIMLLENELR